MREAIRQLVLDGKIEPGKMFDLRSKIDQVAEGCGAMDERSPINAYLGP